MERELQALEEIIAAASATVAPEYFQLPVADADSVYRERVYAYELYHQLRCVWGHFPFSLGGEVDKKGNPHFQDGPYATSKPDLLIHVPGEMERNLACVEVKPFARPVAEFTSDLEKLTWFCKHARYYRGIFLVYGANPQHKDKSAEIHNKVRAAFEAGTNVEPGLIHVFHHAEVGHPIRRLA
jgi:hypothetical protein